MRDGSMLEPFWKDNERAAFELLYVDEARIESVLVMRDQEADRGCYVRFRKSTVMLMNGHHTAFLSQVGVENASRRIDRDDGSGIYLNRKLCSLSHDNAGMNARFGSFPSQHSNSALIAQSVISQVSHGSFSANTSTHADFSTRSN